MKKIFIFASLLLIAFTQTHGQQVIPLYNTTIPGSRPAPADFKETAETGTDGVLRISKVSAPSLTVFAPAKANGTAVIICPGGGYSILAFEKEGTLVAKKFAEIGITAFVLKYRLPSEAIMTDKTLGPLQDALQAIYLVRKNAAAWGIDSHKIGIMGFSAGGHLASSLSVHYSDMKIGNQENISLRPDFSVLIYPVINFGQYTHSGSIKSLLGDESTPQQRRYFSSELQVNANTPPAFLVHANNDGTVSVKNSILYNEALTRNKVPAELHIYQAGGHGFGLYNKTTKEDWFESLKSWMQQNNWL